MWRMSSAIKKTATVRHPSVGAVLHGLLRLPTRDAALEQLDVLRKHFVTSKRISSAMPDTLVLWIKGYDISEEEKALGYLGHYVRMNVQEGKGFWTIKAEKLPVTFHKHPQRKYPEHKINPNWGHPTLRRIKKGLVFETLEEANEVLGALHQEFPKVTIPAINKLFLMIYTRATGGKPMKKFIFEVVATKEGAFTITWRENPKTAKKALPPVAIEKEMKKPDNAPQGVFSAKEKLRAEIKRRKRSGSAVPTTPPEDG